MDLLDLRIYPDDLLRQKCEHIEEFARSEEELFERMLVTMRHFGGIGLAAPQIGVLKRMIVADIGEGPVKLVNPQVVDALGKDVMGEGCLSIPNVQVDVERSTEIVVRGLDQKGKYIESEVEGLLARVIQHEVDHLNGKLIVDYLSLFEEAKEKDKDGSTHTF